MEKILEKYLWDNFGTIEKQRPFAGDVIDDMVRFGMIKSHKQGYRTLEKWAKKGIYDYGCSLLYGWKNGELN